MISLVYGANAGVGRALATKLAERGDSLILVGRDSDDLDRVAVDVRGRWGTTTTVEIGDAAYPLEVTRHMRALVDRHNIDVAMFPVGVSVDDDTIASEPATSLALVTTNLLSVMAASSVVAESMRRRASGEIVGFSSVAAARGRPRNAAYAAAKRGLESWFESLRADLASSGVNVGLYVLGYVSTNLSYGQSLPLRAATPASIADRVVAELGRGGGRRYAPRWWRSVAFGVRHVPFSLFQRVKV